MLMKVFLKIVIMMFFTHSAIAGILIEPQLMYVLLKETGTVTISGVKVPLEEQSPKGAMFGGKIGYTFRKIAFGLDLSTAELDQEGESYRMTNIGGFLMGKFGNYRLWGGYIFRSEYGFSVEFQDLSGTTFLEEGTITGAGPKIGFGYQLAKYASMNLEWTSLTYDKENFDLLGSVDIKQTGFMISLSFPFGAGSKRGRR
jgi:hypothetical protein